MTISFDRALGIHPMALQLRDRRTELLAGNLANADTPNFKARDLDFQSVLKGVDPSALALNKTQPNHQSKPLPGTDGEALYRVPAQASLDGNTVETEQEHVRFAENALQYQASLSFIERRFAGLKTAIRGE